MNDISRQIRSKLEKTVMIDLKNSNCHRNPAFEAENDHHENIDTDSHKIPLEELYTRLKTNPETGLTRDQAKLGNRGNY